MPHNPPVGSCQHHMKSPASPPYLAEMRSLTHIFSVPGQNAGATPLGAYRAVRRRKVMICTRMQLVLGQRFYPPSYTTHRPIEWPGSHRRRCRACRFWRRRYSQRSGCSRSEPQRQKGPDCQPAYGRLVRRSRQSSAAASPFPYERCAPPSSPWPPESKVSAATPARISRAPVISMDVSFSPSKK